MKKIYLSVAAILGASAVALGAMGAHLLKEKAKAGLITPDQVSAFDTASKYQLFHALALLIVFQMNKKENLKTLNWAANFFITGTVFFSGSIYLLSTRNLTGIGGIGFLGPITPLGGLAFMLGWICILLQSFKKSEF